MKKDTRSPLKSRSIRTQGESLRDYRINLALDKVLLPLFTAIFCVFIAGMEWVRYFGDYPPSPWLWSIVAAVATLFAAFQLIRAIPKVRRLRQAEEGERAVGQYLESLREQGYHVFHDILGDGFNVDHVLIGPGGVFTVETKTWSKPAKGEAKIRYDGQAIQVGLFKPDRSPVVQASAQAGWLRALLEESTGMKPTVRPVVVFPGWYIDSEGASRSPVWVLNPKALPKYLSNASEVFSPDQVKLMSYHLSRFIRGSQEELTQHRRSLWRTPKVGKSDLEI